MTHFFVVRCVNIYKLQIMCDNFQRQHICTNEYYRNKSIIKVRYY
jgi:hypothetical protein